MFPERLTNMTQAKRLQSIILKDRNSCAKKTCRAVAGPHWRLNFGNTQVLWLLLDRFWGAVCWQPTGLIVAELTLGLMSCRQPTGFMRLVGPHLGLYFGYLQVLSRLLNQLWADVDNLQVLWDLLDRIRGCALATYRFYGGCWTDFGADVDNLQVLWDFLDRIWAPTFAFSSVHIVGSLTSKLPSIV